MKYRKLGKNGPLVSALGLGCMGMSPAYGLTNNTTSLEVIKLAYDQGITFFDTADMYGAGENEKLVGKAIEPFRDGIILATKCGIRFVDGECKIDNTKGYIKKACEESLKRLNVDFIDLYYLHRHNPLVPLSESMEAMLELIQEGKIGAVGLSEVDTEVLEEANKILGPHLIALQTEYSIMNDKFAKKVLPTCRKLDIAFVSYSPIGRGLLSGKIQDTSQFINDTSIEFRSLLPQFQNEALTSNLLLIRALSLIAKKKGCTLSQLSLAWLLAQGEDIIPIPGTKRIDYLDENNHSVDICLTKEDLESIETAREDHPIRGERYPDQLMELFNLKL